MVRRVWRREAREFVVGPPVEVPGLDDHAAHRRAVAGQELGQRVDYDIRSVFERLAQVWRRHRVVHDQGQAVVVCDVGPRSKVGHHRCRIRDRFAKQELGFVVDGRAYGVEIHRVHEPAGPAEAIERMTELGDRTAIQRPRCDEVVAWAQQRKDREQLGRVARSAGDGGPSAFEGGHPFLQRADRRIAETGVDEAEVLQVE